MKDCCPKCNGAYKDSDLDNGICRDNSCECHSPTPTGACCFNCSLIGNNPECGNPSCPCHSRPDVEVQQNFYSRIGISLPITDIKNGEDGKLESFRVNVSDMKKYKEDLLLSRDVEIIKKLEGMKKIPRLSWINMTVSEQNYNQALTDAISIISTRKGNV